MLGVTTSSSRITTRPRTIVAIGPGGEEIVVEGSLEGAVATDRGGNEGFGYDPVFVPEGETRTVAQLGDAWKASNSHRARATRALAVALRRLE